MPFLCASVRKKCRVPPVGLEPTDPNLQGIPEKQLTATPENALAHSLAQDSQIDPDLARLIDAWPTLPAAIRMGILAMIEAARSS
jgi:hypothetical protein